MIYLSGKITGNPKYKEQFDIAAQIVMEGAPWLKLDKETFFNPAELPEGKTKAEYMRICFAALEMADVVAMLPNWQDSAGAKLEHDYAKYLEKLIVYIKIE